MRNSAWCAEITVSSGANFVAAAQKVPPSVIATATSIPPSVTATASAIPPSVIAAAQTIPPSVTATATKFAPELTVISAHQALFLKLASYKTEASIPPALLTEAINDAGGGLRGLYILSQISAHKAAITSVAPYATALKTVAPYATQLTTIAPYATQLKAIAPYASELKLMSPYSAQLTALSKVPASVLAFLKAHGTQVLTASANAPGQWKTWFWVCFGGIIFFLLTIPLLKGRWSPAAARRDEREHEAMVAAELAKLNA